MTPESVLSLAQQTLQIMLLIAAPPLLAALLTGLLVSVFQAATQINEMTLSFIPKLLAMAAALPLTGCEDREGRKSGPASQPSRSVLTALCLRGTGRIRQHRQSHRWLVLVSVARF